MRSFQATEEIKASFTHCKLNEDKLFSSAKTPHLIAHFSINSSMPMYKKDSIGPPIGLTLLRCLTAGASLPWVTGVSKDSIAAAANNLPTETNPQRAMNGVDHLLLCYRSVVGFLRKTYPKSKIKNQILKKLIIFLLLLKFW